MVSLQIEVGGDETWHQLVVVVFVNLKQLFLVGCLKCDIVTAQKCGQLFVHRLAVVNLIAVDSKCEVVEIQSVVVESGVLFILCHLSRNTVYELLLVGGEFYRLQSLVVIVLPKLGVRFKLLLSLVVIPRSAVVEK